MCAERFEIFFDHELERPKRPPGPQWLRDLLGDEFFATVLGAHFAGINDEGLSHIAGANGISLLD